MLPALHHTALNFRNLTFITILLLFIVYLTSHLFLPQPYPQPKPNSPPSSAWPHTPFHTKSTLILNNENNPVPLAGTNWPGHGLPMVPEGLQHASIRDIVSRIKSLGMNVVRLTYATEMVDDLFARGGEDVGLRESLVAALDQSEGENVYARVVRWNPDLGGEGVTRLDVFDAVAEELARQEIYIHLDNHVSKAGWCCSLEDGNGWFGDEHFDTTQWLRGLTYMSEHAHIHWRSHISTSLRNELRDTPSNPPIHVTYNWTTWYSHMIPAINTVHTANPDTLIFVSGMDYDRTLEPVIYGQDLGDGTVFDLRAMGESVRQKIVWEVHNYNNSITSCEMLTDQLDRGGFGVMRPDTLNSIDEDRLNTAPVVLTEFGFSQTSDNIGLHSVYAQCLKQYVAELGISWMYWVVVGSYYEREGTSDYDEGWGMLDRNWKQWRNRQVVEEYFVPLAKLTIEGKSLK